MVRVSNDSIVDAMHAAMASGAFVSMLKGQLDRLLHDKGASEQRATYYKEQHDALVSIEAENRHLLQVAQNNIANIKKDANVRLQTIQARLDSHGPYISELVQERDGLTGSHSQAMEENGRLLEERNQLQRELESKTSAWNMANKRAEDLGRTAEYSASFRVDMGQRARISYGILRSSRRSEGSTSGDSQPAEASNC